MTSNFNEYQLTLQARKSRKFKELDDKVRAMTIALGRGDKTVNQTEYKNLVKLRDQELQAYINSVTPPAPQFDRTIFQKLDSTVTKKLDTYIAKFPNTKLKNIILMGGTGTGKTYCVKLVTFEIRQKGYSVNFTSTYNLIKRMKDNLYGQDASAPAEFINCDLLVIDDLGTEPTINNGDELLYTVINERYTNNKAIIITTNLDKKQIETRYEQRLFGRIFDQNRTAEITLKGKDLRIE